MVVLNSSINFVVYVLTSRRFRRDLLTALGCVRSAESALSDATVIARSSSCRRGHQTTEPRTTHFCELGAYVTADDLELSFNSTVENVALT